MTKNLARHENENEKDSSAEEGEANTGSRMKTMMTRIQRPSIFKPTNQALYVHEGEGNQVGAAYDLKREKKEAKSRYKHAKRDNRTGEVQSLRGGINIVAETYKVSPHPMNL